VKAVIIGGVAGGATAAARIRRLDEGAEIVILEKSGFISYANCGLPYFIGGVIEDPRELTLQTPEGFRRRFNIDVRVKNEATAIDPSRKTVTVRELESGRIYTEEYDKLLLSPGARPTVPAGYAGGGERIFTLRTVEDTLKIRRFVKESGAASAVIAGGGYIGLEMAENLIGMGIRVTIVQRPRQLLAPLDPDMAAFVHARALAAGLELRLGCPVDGFEERDERVRTLIKDGEPLLSDMVILAVGVTPDSSLAREAGLELGLKGAIIVDERMRTSAPDVYAVGDAVQIKHRVLGTDAVIPLAGPANRQGRVAADNICGLDSVYRGSMGSSIIKLFDLTAAATGVGEKAARAAGIDYEKVILSPASHAAYYPGAETMTMKVLCDRATKRVIGAQIVGAGGVDKRIDVLSAAISAGLTGPELGELDLAYAPPYSSAKDPVNMAGFMFDNIFAGRIRQFHWDEVEALPTDGSVTLLDVRTPREYERGHVEGFMNIEVDALRSRLDELDKARPVYVMCQSGIRSYIACCILAANGLECFNFSGGYRFYGTVKRNIGPAQSSLPCGMEK